MGEATIAVNRRARFDYDIIERFEAGIVLSGSEIKSVRDHKVQLQGSYARIKDGEVWLQDANIAPYESAGYAKHDPRQDRKLLLHKKEIARIQELLGEKGYTLIPMSMYFKRGVAKVELGVGRGRKQYDKRQKIREREEGRQVARHLRHSA